MRLVLLVVIVLLAANGFALRPSLAGSAEMWLVLVAAYTVLSAIALYAMWNDGTLVERLSPRWGDISLGAITAIVLLVASWGARAALAPAGSPQNAWLLHIYLQIGSPDRIQRSVELTLLVVLVPVLEELVWRGLVLDRLGDRFGQRRGWPLAALLYAVALLPSVFLLADPAAGPNPLLIVAALGCGIVWSFMASIGGRLPPVIISHVAFTYFSALQFRWPGM
jgi:hypothetical protein